MLKKILMLSLICMGIFASSVKAQDFTVLDEFTFNGPFTVDGVVTPEFFAPVYTKSLELVVTYHVLLPDGCCTFAGYALHVGLEGKSPVGDWYEILRETAGISGTNSPTSRVILVGRDLVFLSGENVSTSETLTSSHISYVYGEIPRDLRVRFSLDIVPRIPPRVEDLKRFTVSVSGRMFNQ